MSSLKVALFIAGGAGKTEKRTNLTITLLPNRSPNLHSKKKTTPTRRRKIDDGL